MKFPQKRWLALLALCSLPLAAQAQTRVKVQAPTQERIAHGLFDAVTLYRPRGEVQSFTLFLSGNQGWDARAAAMAQALADHGAMVAGIDTPALVARLEASDGDCVFPDGDLENLSRFAQGYARLPGYFTPVLVGYSSGAALAYALVSQAQAGTFAGALSLGFCPQLDIRKALCRDRNQVAHSRIRTDGKGVNLLPASPLVAPWTVLQGDEDAVCPLSPAAAFAARVPGAELVALKGVGHGFVEIEHWLPQYIAAYSRLAAKTADAVALPGELASLPLVEVESPAGSDTFAVFLSGDGGWAGLDKNVAAALSAKGIPVAGLDSLRYFWTPRTPDGLATDLDRVLRHYAMHWKKSRALLIGYSQGADVLPFAVNRLPLASKGLVAQTVLMGLGEKASFEFHLGNWMVDDDEGVPILPEAVRLDGARTLCLYGDEEQDSLCPRIPAGHVRAMALPGGHHFDGAYEQLAELILRSAKAQ